MSPIKKYEWNCVAYELYREGEVGNLTATAVAAETARVEAANAQAAAFEARAETRAASAEAAVAEKEKKIKIYKNPYVVS